jgi:hypothetical protein
VLWIGRLFEKNGMRGLPDYVETGRMPDQADVLPYSEENWQRMLDGSLANT